MTSMTTTKTKDVGGVGVDRVIVSQATREMAAGVRTRDESAAELQRQENAVAQIIDEKMKVQRRLSELSDGNKGKMHATSKFIAINEEKVKLKSKLTDLELRLATEKRTLYRLRDEARAEQTKNGHKNQLESRLDKMATEMRAIRQLCEEILRKLPDQVQ